MTLPLQFAGHNRVFRLPRSIRAAAGSDEVTGWELFELEQHPDTAAWATVTLESLIAAADAEVASALGCTDCEDIGYYGLTAADNPDLLTGLVRRQGNDQYEQLTADGVWNSWREDADLELLQLDLAGDLAAAITAGACGLLRRYAWPKAFLSPEQVVSATTVSSLLSAAEGSTPHSNQVNTDTEWVNYGLVDDVDVGAVLDVVRITASMGTAERFIDGQWTADDDLLLDGSIALVPLEDSFLATLLADAPLTVSPNPKAEKLRRYWSTGRGAAKIRWGTKGDWRRCYRHLRKHMGLRAKGYCQNLHKRNNGYWTGDRRNRGIGGSLEESLLSSIRSGHWTGTKEEGTDMADAQLKDGIYAEILDGDVGIQRTLTAGGFPDVPPADWYKNPNFTKLTPMTIDDDGRVYGHIADWESNHIGMAGSTKAPHSPTDYAYFKTGTIKVDDGSMVNIGQLTLTGGHAPLTADSRGAVAHYDDTRSAVADVNVGEDKYGIWAAGSLRSTVTPDQVRVFRASPLSGDWRVINGAHEMVAACAVNVPGFPIVRARVAGGAVVALVAAGSRQLALLQASANAESAVLERLHNLEAKIAAIEPAPAAEVTAEDPGVVITIDGKEVAGEIPAEAVVLDAEVTPAETPAATEEPETPAEPEAAAEPAKAEEAAEVPDTPEEVESTEPTEEAKAASIAEEARKEVESIRAQLLRDEVESLTSSAGERRGGGYPITDVASLKDAIQAFGRAKPEDKAKTKAHIISKAKELGRSDLIPDTWK